MKDVVYLYKQALDIKRDLLMLRKNHANPIYVPRKHKKKYWD